MANLAHSTSFFPVGGLLSLDRRRNYNQFKLQKQVLSKSSNRLAVCCSSTSPWEPAPVTYALTNDAGSNFLHKTDNLFETLNSNQTGEVALANAKEVSDANPQPVVLFEYVKWTVWLLGPAILLVTGMVPTLWLPVSSVFLGPNIGSLLSLTGLDCIFNLGAFLFLLLADTCARPRNLNHAFSSKPPFSYQFWNMVANVMGVMIPLLVMFGSQKGFLQPILPSISFLVLLGPYLLLLSVQIVTEMLIWHWQSPVWLVTPVVYESYRLLQLMRGLKLAAELTAPSWILHTIRGLVCWWVLVLGMQLMRVAWYAGLTARGSKQETAVYVDDT
ncbi:OLC1v1002140C1 [Oldenlandia corymbosa var. corymbosa]|uniref:OLC1v1002140C1 n=1 Tax=Oldenlandia corymbosa var. corymbosa TaxID=529605 RepID=A0AAV1D996_OLDCO|nr:OLC1v1002140C1 [Oldenlandia corymbosa var. corymbosa]